MAGKKKRKGGGKPHQAGSARKAGGPQPSASESRSINKLGLIVSVVVMAMLIGAVLVLGPGEPPSSGDEELEGTFSSETLEESLVAELEKWQQEIPRRIPVSTPRDFIRGSEDAPVQIIEFSDFQCPYCRTATKSLVRVLDRYPNEVQLVYKNLPLDNSCNEAMRNPLHADACRAAVMARCAGASSPANFWRFHDQVFASNSLSPGALTSIADALGIRDRAFAACLSSGDALREVQEDIQHALELGLNSTPSIFVNGRKAPSYEFEVLSKIIDHIVSSD